SEPEPAETREPDLVPKQPADEPPAHAIVEERPVEPKAKGPMRIDSVVAEAADANSVTHVSVRVGDRIVSGVCPRKGGSVLRSVALATINAIVQVDPDVKLDVRDVYMTESENGVRFISVTGTGRVGGEERPIGGVGTVGRDLYFTIAEATLQAYSNWEAALPEPR
ncbi:MAG TPA: hypothetical protein VMI31_15415, partial [Fimbriimonadaceae bacterium]|nr:hypothetical protein [Fimbriimonadaceae bacterium]